MAGKPRVLRIIPLVEMLWLDSSCGSFDGRRLRAADPTAITDRTTRLLAHRPTPLRRMLWKSNERQRRSKRLRAPKPSRERRRSFLARFEPLEERRLLALSSASFTGGTYSQNFDGLASATSPTFTGAGPFDLIGSATASPPAGVGAASSGAGDLTGWSFALSGGSGAVARFAIGDGSTSTGATYSFGTGSATDRALGAIGTSTTQSTFGATFTNNSGQAISQLTIAYTGEQWRTGASNLLAFGYEVGGTNILDAGFTTDSNLNFTPINTGTSGPLDGNNAANDKSISDTITGLNWQPGQTLMIRWAIGGVGQGVGLGVDNFTLISAVGAKPPTVTTSAGALSYLKGAGTVAVDPGVTVADQSLSSLASATVAITGNYVQGEDHLSFATQGAISGSFDASKGVLTLTGGASVSAYQSALQSVLYSDSSNTPSTAQRTVTFIASDGTQSSAPATRLINVLNISQPPVNTVPGPQTVVTGTTLTFSSAANNAISVADSSVGNANILVTLAVTQGTLTVSNVGGLATITGNSSASITMTGSIANINAALNGLVFDAPSSADPVTLTITSDDLGNGGGSEQTAISTVAITVALPAPVLTATSGSVSYNEKSAPIVVDSGLSISDPGATTLASATVKITGNYAQGEDVLAVSAQGLSSSFDATTATLTLQGNATLAVYQAALRAVTYVDTRSNPSILQRTVTFQVNDGTLLSNAVSRTVNVSAILSLPNTQSTSQNNTLVLSTASSNPIVVTSNSPTVTMTVGVTAGTLSLATTSGLSSVTGNNTASITIAGTPASVNTAINGLKYLPALFLGTATLSVSLQDQNHTQIAGGTVAINVVKELLINELFFNPPGGDSPNDFIELRAPIGGAVTLPQGTYLVSVDGTAGDDGHIQDVFDLSGKQTGSNGFLVLLDKNSPYPVDSQANVLMNSGSGAGFGSGSSSSIGHTGINAATDIAHASISYMLIQSSVAPTVNDDIDANDDGVADGSLFSQWSVLDSVGALGKSSAAGDFSYAAITFVNTGGLGVALSGTTVPVGFSAGYVGRTGNTTGSAATDWVASDLAGGSAPLFALDPTNVSIPSFAGRLLDTLGSPNFNSEIPSSVTTTAGTVNFTEKATIVVDPGLTIANTHAFGIDHATVAITGSFVAGQDVLAFAAQQGITAVYDSTTGVLTLSGAGTLAAYQAALRTVTYTNASGNPSLAPRTIAFTVFDGTIGSGAASRSMTITAVDDPPVNGVPGLQTTPQDVAVIFSTVNGNMISVADPDAGSAPVQVTLTVPNGILNLGSTSGLTNVTGNQSASITFEGSLAAINQALNGLSLAPPAGFQGSTTLTITTDDLGNTGIGGPLSATNFVSIFVSLPVFSQTGNVLTLTGTVAADVLLLDFTSQTNFQVTFNGDSRSFSTSSVSKIVFFAGPGVDTVTANTAPGPDMVTFCPGFLMMNGVGYQFLVNGAENITVTGDANDTAALNDSAGADVYTARPTDAVLQGTGYRTEAKNFAHVIGFSTTGKDVAYFYDSAGNDALIATPTWTSLTGAGFDNRAIAYHSLYAFATAGGADIANLYGSAATDTLVTLGSVYSRLTGTGFSNQVNGFARVSVEGNGGPDAAWFYDDNQNTALSASGNSGTTVFPRASVTAYDFPTLNVIASSPTASHIKRIGAIDFALKTSGSWVSV
jgi:hypothetical protein